MSRYVRVSILFLAVLGLAATSAHADDPGDDFPPPTKDDKPAEKPADAPADSPPADNPPPKKDEKPAGKTSETPPTSTGWSPPAVTPGRGSNLGNLPPPTVRRRRGGTSPSRAVPSRSTTTPTRMATAPVGRTTTPPPSGSGTPIRRTPGGTATPPLARTPGGTATPRPPAPPAAGTQPGRTPTTAATGAGGRSGVGGSRIYGVAKTHNVSIDRGAGAEPDLALQLDVDYEVRGQAGRDVYVAIWFARADTGELIATAAPAYGDRNRNITLQTRSARVGGESARYKATLRIPYRAFPIAEGEASYDVEARVQVLRTERNGRVSVLCRDSTTFRVYGYDEAEGE